MDDHEKVIIIEDDRDDTDTILDIMKDLDLKHICIVFDDGDKALDYISKTSENIIMVISDISLPRMDGLKLKKKLEEDPILKKKSIPFIFFTAIGRQQAINEAFVSANVNGYFNKSSDYNVMKEDLKIVFDYWSRSQRPT